MLMLPNAKGRNGNNNIIQKDTALIIPNIMAAFDRPLSNCGFAWTETGMVPGIGFGSADKVTKCSDKVFVLKRTLT